MNIGNLGFKGEDLACNYLEKQGYEIIARNFFCNQGEIDIIAKDKKEFVFIEVKTRSNFKYGNPIDAVNYYKKKHIWNASRYYIYKNNLESRFIRFDVIEVLVLEKTYKINQIKNIMI